MLPLRLILALSVGALALSTAACQQEKIGEARLRLDPTNWEMAFCIDGPPFTVVDQANLLDGLSNFPADVEGSVELDFDGTDLTWTVVDSDIGADSVVWPDIDARLIKLILGVVGGDGPAWFGNFTMNGSPIPGDMTSPDGTWVTQKVLMAQLLSGNPWTLEADFLFEDAPGPNQERPKIFIELIAGVPALPGQ
jgi:hypothetical protein